MTNPLYVLSAVSPGLTAFRGFLDTMRLSLIVFIFAISGYAAPAFSLEVTGVNPEDGAVDVSTYVNPRVDFSAEVDPTTVNDNTIFITDSQGVFVPSSLVPTNNRVYLYRPGDTLNANETYTIHVTTGLLDASGFSLPTEFTSTFTTQFSTGPLEVTGVYPEDGAVDLSTYVNPRVDFSAEVDPTTVNDNTIFITDSQGVFVPSSLVPTNNRVYLYRPGDTLNANETYTIHVTTGLLDASGFSLSTEFTSTFTTQFSTGPLEVTGVYPEDGAVDVSTYVNPRVDFSAEVDPTTVNDNTIFITDSQGIFVPSSLVPTNNRVYLYRPGDTLNANETYTIHVTTGLLDASGFSLSTEFTSAFTTQFSTGPLEVTGVYPEDGAVDVSTYVNPHVDFSAEVDPTTVNDNTIFITDSQGVFVPSSLVPTNNRVYLYRPGDTLNANETYTIHVTTDLLDLSGFSLPAEFTSTFTTAYVQLIANIDIKPRKKPENIIDFKKNKNLKVSIIGDETFYASLVDPTTVTFGPRGASPVRSKVKDYNRDGFFDLILTFRLKDTGIECGQTEATLTGELDGIPFTGTDIFTTENCQ